MLPRIGDSRAQTPGTFVTIETADGTQHTIPWERVKEVAPINADCAIFEARHPGRSNDDPTLRVRALLNDWRTDMGVPTLP